MTIIPITQGLKFTRPWSTPSRQGFYVLIILGITALGGLSASPLISKGYAILFVILINLLAAAMYWLLAQVINHTELLVTREAVHRKTHPLPWLGEIHLPADKITCITVQEILASRLSHLIAAASNPDTAMSAPRSYQMVAVMKDRRVIPLSAPFPQLQEAERMAERTREILFPGAAQAEHTRAAVPDLLATYRGVTAPLSPERLLAHQAAPPQYRAVAPPLHPERLPEAGPAPAQPQTTLPPPVPLHRLVVAERPTLERTFPLISTLELDRLLLVLFFSVGLAAIALVFFQGSSQALAAVCLGSAIFLYIRQIRRLALRLYPLALFRLANESARGQVLELCQTRQGEDLCCRVKLSFTPAELHTPNGPVELWASVHPNLFTSLHPGQPLEVCYAIANPQITVLCGDIAETR